MGDSEPHTPSNGSPAPAIAIEEEPHDADLPLTMTASVVLTQLPYDAATALRDAGNFDKPKGIPMIYPPPNNLYKLEANSLQ